MEFKFESVVFTRDPAAWKEFTQTPSGTVGSDLRRRGRKLIVLAERTVQKKTGELARSINMSYYPTRNPFIKVGSDAQHALMMHDGVKPHVILPDQQQMLKFMVKGKVVYARRVMHPGSRGSFYLTRHLRKVVK